MPANHNKPHTPETREKIRLAKLGVRYKWGHLPESRIVQRLLETDATTRSIAAEYGCSDSTVKLIFRRHTTKEDRLNAKNRKAAASKRGRSNPIFAKWLRTHKKFNKGRKHTDATKHKWSEAKKGKRHSVGRRIAQSARIQGISVKEWSEFATPKADRLRRSLKHRNWRESVFKRDDWTCQSCGRRGHELHPHHIKSKCLYPEIMFDIDNGITLCADCHRRTPTHGVNLRYQRQLSS